MVWLITVIEFLNKKSVRLKLMIQLTVRLYESDRQTDRQHAIDGVMVYRLPHVRVLYRIAR